MERIKNAYKNMPLKRALTVTIVCSLMVSALLGAFLLVVTRPSYYRLTADNPQSVALRVHDGVTILLLVLCIIAPILTGIYFFYKHKLLNPIQALMEGTQQIARDNLDFRMDYDANDEFGALCQSFEKMRKELQSNEKQMWRMTQQRKELNAAFAHDLRTPLTVLRGYTDFLEEYIPSAEKSDEKLLSTNRMMTQYVKRLEDYVETMNTIQKLEDTPIKISSISVTDFISMLSDNLQVVSEERGYAGQFSIQNKMNLTTIKGDIPLIFRVLENVTGNAFQYAGSEVTVCLFSENNKLTDNRLIIEVTDDGAGFEAKDLEQALNPFYTSAKSDSLHFGMGLAICKTLCENHGGKIVLENTTNMGAKVQVSFLLEN